MHLELPLELVDLVSHPLEHEGRVLLGVNPSTRAVSEGWEMGEMWVMWVMWGDGRSGRCGRCGEMRGDDAPAPRCCSPRSEPDEPGWRTVQARGGRCREDEGR